MVKIIHARGIALICVAVALVGLITGAVSIIEEPDVPESTELPDQQYNVTCYKWVENGTAKVQCPDTVYAPNSVVNITVRECEEYRFMVDEPHPCPHFRDDETN